MKSMKKSLLLVLCALALITASVFGTLAYLTDTAQVLNTFTVGNVSIKLDETKVNPNGDPVDGDDEGAEADRTEEGNVYHLIPGGEYTKDPTVTMLKGSDDAYVRMKVTISDYADVKAVFGEDFLPQDFVAGWDNEIWLTTSIITVDDEKDTATYEFRYKEIVSGGEEEDLVLSPLFTSITVPGEVTGDDLAKLDKFTIAIVGEAIQAAGFDTEAAAWEAFDAQASKGTEATPASVATESPAFEPTVSEE